MNLRGKSVGILGMARSGLAAAKLVKQRGGIPFVSDHASSERLATAAKELESHSIDYETGKHILDILSKKNLIVLSPGVSIQDPFVRNLIQSEIEVISELELAYRCLECPIIAVTGTNGKTTTVALIAHILTQAGIPNASAGNIGKPLSAVVEHLHRDDWAVVEVSSFQLEASPTFRPKIAAILNVTPDHLDRHGTFEHYLELKQQIFRNQTNGDTLVYNADDPVVTKMIHGAKSKKVGFALKSNQAWATIISDQIVLKENGHEIPVMLVSEIPIPGAHNVENVLAAVACTNSIGVQLETIREGIRSFKGVEHRLEAVGTFHGVRWVNDSKATNVESGITALKAMSPPIILLAGGRAKMEDYARAIPYFANRVKSVIAFGEAGSMLETTWGSSVELHRVGGLQDAVALAAKLAQEGDTVLLSPMGSSFDEFQDFEDRGYQFKQWVKMMCSAVSSPDRV
jgi:UDP-N-acetylmuramoylalanine--D-glutamate ligase